VELAEGFEPPTG